MIFFRFIITLLFFCGATLGNSYAQTWRYVDPLDKKTDLILENNKATKNISIGHQVYAAKYCSNSEKFTCFEGGVLALAIPKTPFLPKRWNYAGKYYFLQDEGYVYILGRKVKAYIIEAANPDGLSFVYLYSPLRGLVAVKSKSESARLLILEASCGFGASKKCQ